MLLERRLLENEIKILAKAIPFTEKEFDFKEDYFYYGRLTEKSFLREADKTTMKKSDGEELYIPDGGFVQILQEDADWILVEGGAVTRKNKVPVNGTGWIKLKWGRIKKAVLLEKSDNRRSIKFELQLLNNYVRRSDGKTKKWLPRKYRFTYLHKGLKGDPPSLAKDGRLKEGTAIELQSETNGVLEFETAKWFKNWCELKEKMEEAAEICDTFNKQPVKNSEDLHIDNDGKAHAKKRSGTTKFTANIVDFPAHFNIDHLRVPNKISRPGEHLKLSSGEILEVAIIDSGWEAKIQISEAIDLEHYDSLLRQHTGTATADEALLHASNVLKKINGTDLTATYPALTAFLQVICYYMRRGQEITEKGQAKTYFRTMCRTSFSSIFRQLLNNEEKTNFRNIVFHHYLQTEFGLSSGSKLLKAGHSTGSGPTINKWLNSITSPIRGKDLLSYSADSKLNGGFNGSESMGRFDIVSPENKVRFEIRGSVDYGKGSGGMLYKATDWVTFAEKVFKDSFAKRKSKNPKNNLEYKSSCSS